MPTKKKNLPLIIANWKMNLLVKDAITYLKQFKKDFRNSKSAVEAVICPSYTALGEAREILKGSSIRLGAQDLSWQDKGSYTGEISPQMIKETGCKYVIIGHSERRKHLNEDDAMINKKVITALEQKLIPIICVGETFEQRQSGQKDIVVMRQLTQALYTIDEPKETVIAYEPVWVIGSGQAVQPEEALHSTQVIRHTLRDLYPEYVIEDNFRVIYGGSVDKTNVKGFVDGQIINGVLVGTASLKEKDFMGIINIFK